MNRCRCRYCSIDVRTSGCAQKHRIVYTPSPPHRHQGIFTSLHYKKAFLLDLLFMPTICSIGSQSPLAMRKPVGLEWAHRQKPSTPDNRSRTALSNTLDTQCMFYTAFLSLSFICSSSSRVVGGLAARFVCHSSVSAQATSHNTISSHSRC